MGKKVRGGFTLVELSLSLIFIGILSITVVLLIQNLSASYRRGLILNQLNTVGMDLIDEMRVSVQNATSDPVTRMCELYYPDYEGVDRANRDACVNDHADSFVSVTKMAQVTTKDNRGTHDLGQMPVYGAFCTGTYTFIWNSGYFESAEDSEERTVHGTAPAELWKRNSEGIEMKGYDEEFRLLKVYDDERSICVNAMKSQNEGVRDINTYIAKSSPNYKQNKIPYKFVVAEAMINDEKPVEILQDDDTADLVLYDLTIAKPALSTTRKNLFYAATMILGTRRGGIDLKGTGNSCKPPSDDYSELEYCAINKFNFAVMAGGA